MKRSNGVFKEFIRRTDLYLFLMCFFTSVYGCLMVYSATRYSLGEDGHFSREFIVMVAAVALGLAAAVVISLIDYRAFTKFWYVIAGVCVVLMLLLFKFGTGPSARSDVHTWLKFGPVNFQPSELVKIGFIITFSVHLEKLRDKLNSIFSIVQLGAHALVPIALVALTGDMGSSLVFIVIAAVMLFAAGVHWGYFVGIFAVIAASSPLLWLYGLKQLQRDRVLALIHPDLYPDIIYQQKYGLNAIGSGGLFGVGFTNSTLKHLYLPEPQNDFIFAIVCEEFGFIGAIGLIILFGLFVWRGFIIASKAPDCFSRLLAAGITCKVGVQALLNIFVVTGLFPPTGISMPFISYGGTALIILLVECGILLSISKFTRGKETGK